MDPPLHLIIVLLLGVFLTKTTVWTQDAPAPNPEQPNPGGNAETDGKADPSPSDTKFISFEEGIDDADIFRRDKLEYLIIPDKRPSHAAYLTCNEYNAVLAYFEDVSLAKFLADALSETRLELDTLWVAGKRDNTTNTWLWKKEDKDVALTPDIVNLIVKSDDLKIAANDRDCLGFGRELHDLPQLRPLACRGKRAIICQRSRGKGGKGNSTHPGWIKIGERLYKIFADKVNYDTAEAQCPEIDPDASLAVVPSVEVAEQLGRYLLIGRPSLENAWMGGKWAGNEYRFDAESLEISNNTDSGTRYPPWRDDHMRKPLGCLLLDRHLANRTYFVEARCTRERAVICYKMTKNETGGTNHSDVIIGDAGYRLIYDPKLIWEKARDFCSEVYQKWNAKLIEIDNAKTNQNLLYVMGENKTAVQHIWTAGYFNQSKWTWVSQNTPVDMSVLNWVKNNSYEDIAEHDNRCLNMDRENHIVALHYGARCKFAQAFVCSFTADQLRALQAEEALNRTNQAKAA